MTVNGGTSEDLTVFLGKGDGTLQPGVNYKPGVPPASPLVGDFNHDGVLDFAVSGGSADTGYVNMMFGHGDGTFTRGGVFTAGGGAGRIAAGDFNQDGNLDVAVTQYYGGSQFTAGRTNVLFGNGDGTFGSPTPYSSGADPSGIVASDVNLDGWPDLIVADNGFLGPSAVSVLINAGNGTSLPAVSYTAGDQPLAVLAADYDGDGFPDIGVANFNGNQVSLLLNNGDGTFGAAANYATGLDPYAVAAADFDGDGNLDLAVANNLAASVSILPGDGTGRLGSSTAYDGGNSPPWVIAVDLNGDGRPDLVTVDGYLYLIVILNSETPARTP